MKIETIKGIRYYRLNKKEYKKACMAKAFIRWESGMFVIKLPNLFVPVNPAEANVACINYDSFKKK